MNTTPLYKGTLLVVDDVPDNLNVLLDFLSGEGFEVLVAQDGKKCVQRAEYTQPDLILLDVMMPVMDGFMACQILKSQESTHDIPVIFMTARADVVDKVKGFRLGAADYITKPFEQEEVLARVSTHINLRKRTTELEKRTTELEQRNRELDAFAHTVAHDLRSPLSGIIGFSDLLKGSCKLGMPTDERWIERLDWISGAGQQMLGIIDSLLLLAGVSKQTIVCVEPLNMKNIVDNVLKQRLTFMLTRYHHEIKLPSQWPLAQGYAPWIEEIWANYVSNALKYGGRPACLELGADAEKDGMIRFWVQDNGRGLSTEQQIQLFVPFNRLHQKRIEGHGLGLSIVQQIIEKLGGTVGVESEMGKGSLFYFTLPASHDLEKTSYVFKT